MTYMEKDKKSKFVPQPYKSSSKVSKVHESVQAFVPSRGFILKDFTYKDFKKISEKVPFTQQEWSDILHISEKTIQRYSKNNGAFNFSVVDRILQIDKVLRKGTEVFGSPGKLVTWIRTNPIMLEGQLSLLSLASFEGINLILRQLGRIEQGIFA